MAKIFTRNTLIFILIVLVHIGYKMIYLGYSGFGYEESFSLYFSGQDWGLIKHTSEWNMNPPLYYYFLAIWRNFFGVDEFSVRMSSVIFSALTAGILYLFTIKNFNRTAAVIAVLLYTASNQMYNFSNEANSFSILLFLSISSAYLFFNLLDKKNWLSILLLGLCNFLLLYTYYGTISIVVIELFTVLIFFRKRIFQRIGLALLITAVLSYLRFTQKSIEFIFEQEKSFGWAMPDLTELQNTFYEFFNGVNLFWILISITLLSLVYLIYAKNAIVSFKENKIKISHLFFLCAGSIVLCFVLSFFMPLVLNAYFIYIVPFVYVLIGLVISKAEKEIKYVIVGLTCFFILISFSRINFRTNKPMNYKDALVAIKKLQTPETIILVETRDVGHLFAYYYDRTIFLDFKNTENRLREKGIYLVSSVEDMASLDLNLYKRLVFSQTFANLNPHNNEIVKFVSEKYRYKAVSKHFSGVALTLFEK